MRLSERLNADSERKYRVRCFAMALTLQLILHWARWLALEGIGRISFFQRDASYLHFYEPIHGVAKIILTLLVYLIPLKFYLKLTATKPSEILRPRGNAGIYRIERGGRLQKTLFFVFASAITIVVANFAGAITDEICYHLGVQYPAPSVMPLLSSLFLTFISSVILAPIVEETLFRGVAVNALAPYGMGWTVLLSGLFFALMHHSFYSLLYAFCAGCCIAFFAYVSNSLWVAVGLHFVNNLLTFAVAAVRGAIDPSAGERLGSIFMMIAAPVAIVGAVYFAVIKVWRRDVDIADVSDIADGGGEGKEPVGSMGDGGGTYGDPIGSKAGTESDTPVCAELVFYAVFALFSCL